MTRSQDRNERQQQDRQRQLSSRDTGQTKDAVDPNTYRLGHRDPLRGTVQATSADGGTRQASTTYNSSQPTGKVLKSQAGAGNLVLDGPNVRKQPATLTEEEVPEEYPIKWLLVTTTPYSEEEGYANQTQLIVRIGGYKPTPKIVLTLEIDALTTVASRFPSLFPTQHITMYFGFQLSLTGTGTNDWVLSYAKAVTPSIVALPNPGIYTYNFDVTLYKMTGQQSAPTVINTYSATNSYDIQSNNVLSSLIEFNYFAPVGYGRWTRENTLGEFAYSSQIKNEFLLWDEVEYSSISGFDGTDPRIYSGETIVLPGTTKENTFVVQSTLPNYSGQRWNIRGQSGDVSDGYYFYISQDGLVSSGAMNNGENNRTRFVASSGDAITTTIGSDFSQTFYPYRNGVYIVKAIDGSPVNYCFSSDKTAEYRIDKINLDGSLSENIKTGKFYPFMTPSNEWPRPLDSTYTITLFPVNVTSYFNVQQIAYYPK